MKTRLALFAFLIILIALSATILEPPSSQDLKSVAVPVLGQTSTPGPPPTTWWTLAGNPYRTAAVTVGSMGLTGAPTSQWTLDPTGDDFPFHANPVAADFNGDGIIDVALVNAAGALYIVRIDNGVQQLRLAPPDLELGSFSAPTAYDVDGDGRAELIALTASVRTGGKQLVCIKFTTTWSWSVLWRTTLPFVESHPPTSPLVWRLDPNGPPLVLVSAGDGLYAIDATTGFLVWRHKSYGLSFVSSPALLDDVNGDGVLDVVYTRGYPAVVYVVSGKDGKTIREWRLWELDTRLNGLLIIHSPVVGKVVGAVCKDVVVSVGKETFAQSGGLWYKSGSVGYLVVLNPCTNAFYVISPPSERTFFVWFSQPAIALADVDKDGLDEIFVVGEDLYLHRIDYSPATGTFDIKWSAAPPSPIDPNTGTRDAVARTASLAVVEVNGDGVLDLLVMYQTGSTTSLTYTLRAIRGDTGASIWTATAITETGTGLKYTFTSISVVSVDGIPRAIVTAFDRVIRYG
ncbi:MAG: FG-GAP-like repeat-containing protein [Acidilobaceae archaeon]